MLTINKLLYKKKYKKTKKITNYLLNKCPQKKRYSFKNINKDSKKTKFSFKKSC